MDLNRRALQSVQRLVDQSWKLKVALSTTNDGTSLVDCGVKTSGGLEAGCLMAEACLAGLGHVDIGSGDPAIWSGPWVTVRTDQPIAACMASQYAGWPVNYETGQEKFFAMASGPMRAARGREPLFDTIGYTERPSQVLGILESNQLPSSAVCCEMADQCHVPASGLTLLVAPTASLAGSVQVVARSVETALHKLLELGLDLRQILAGWGTAPLPPVAADDLGGIGRTNDAVLYGARVTLWVRMEDRCLESLGPRLPSCASSDHGRPFAEIFHDYDHDFYKIDPMLFSPAVVELINLDSGHTFCFGRPEPRVLQRSFE